MFKFFKYLFVILTIVTFSSCSGDEDPAFGSISGRVYDYATHVPLAGVHVSLSPSTRSLITDESGNFVFSSLDAGSYTIVANLKGYTPSSSHITVNDGETSRTDILLKPESLMSNLQLSTTSLTFDKGINELTFEIKNIGENGPIKWNINLVTVDWLSVTPNEGTVAEGMSSIVKVIINRKAIPDDKSVSTSFNVSTGETAKSISVYVNNISGGNENPVYGKVRGRITNKADNSPISAATITDAANGVAAKSDASGNFAIENLKPGNYNFQVTADGFESMSKAVYVSVGGIAEADFALQPLSQNIEIVSSTKEIAFGTSTNTRSFTLTNKGNKSASWKVFEYQDYTVPSWLSISKKSGTLAAGASQTITLTVDRTKVQNTYDVFILGIVGEFDNIDITVSIEKEGSSAPVENYSKATITSCDYRVTAEIVSCRRTGTTVTFEYTLTNNGLGTVNDWRVYPPKSMSLISGGTRSVVWTNDGQAYDDPVMTFNNKTTTGANTITATFPQGPKISGSVTIKDVRSSATEFNLTLGVYAYPNSTYHMQSSSIQFLNVPIF